jgi:phosphoribosyl-AMP cyclohydrolase
MMAYMNREALETTLKEGRACYWSRSRQELWRKGATSGDVQIVKDVLVDCDQDTILLLVEQLGKGACHTRKWSCFFRRITPEGEIREINE